ncbi:MAG: hypothetical protein JO267_03645 [Alphaproteobacteria bacterium]|nr:hypothetical protein [Alphaproteobacteria bacterium]
MVLQTENIPLRQQAFAYVTALYRELSQENGAPTVGTQNQALDFILADPELSRAVSEWAKTVETEEAGTRPPQRLPRDALYERVRSHLAAIMGKPVFSRPETQRP